VAKGEKKKGEGRGQTQGGQSYEREEERTRVLNSLGGKGKRGKRSDPELPAGFYLQKGGGALVGGFDAFSVGSTKRRGGKRGTNISRSSPLSAHGGGKKRGGKKMDQSQSRGETLGINVKGEGKRGEGKEGWPHLLRRLAPKGRKFERNRKQNGGGGPARSFFG